jgi:outer membrane receptor for ferrienterochelin and colicin
MHRLILIMISVLMLSSLLLAGTTGKISGTVKDEATGEPVIGASILVEGTHLGAAADVNGYYVILNVSPGKYTVIASAVGYQKATTAGISVQVDLTSKVDFNMKNESVNMKEVVVTAEQPVVRKDLTSVEAHVDAEQIKNIPVTEVRDVLALQTGVTVDNGGGIHIRGGRTSEVAYWVDGRPITDVYDNGQSVSISNNSLQELQVISGTFNAEYGNSMSGIVNIVTKDGGQNYSGSLNLWSGDYISGHNDVWYNIGKVTPTANTNIEASLSGPIPGLGDKLSFFATGRFYKNDGYFYGIRKFTPHRYFTPVERPDSGQTVPMNDQRLYSGQAKLTLQISPMLKLNLGALGSRRDYRDFNHAYTLNPDGDVKKHDRGNDLSAQLTSTISSSAFYTLSIARSYHEYYEFLYDDPYDPRYVDPILFNTQADEFLSGGTNAHRYNRNTTTWDFKGDYTSQLTPVHQFKIGSEFRLHKLFSDDINPIPATDVNGQQIVPYTPVIPSDTSTSHSLYSYNPREFSLYAQDKVEYQNVIINFGLRFDYFDPNANILADQEDPDIYQPFKLEHQYHDLNSDGIIEAGEQTPANKTTLAERQAYWWKSASKKYQLSPRFGVAYPITDRGVIHFSYGHFLQIPSFTNLYDGAQYKVTEAGGTQGVFGNPDLKPQRTVMYELGLQQQLTEDLGIDVTGFYRDVRDWVTSSVAIPTIIAGVNYIIYVNKDYENVRGLTISLNKRSSDYYSYNISYTYQVAEGTNSNPADEFFTQISGGSPVKTLIPMNWDQPHTFNATLGLGDNNLGVFFISRYGSGMPYTPTYISSTLKGQNLSTALPTNSQRKPSNITFDMRAFKTIMIGKQSITLSLKVFNLFDTKNANDVFSDTGDPERTLQGRNVADNPQRVNTVADYLKSPWFFSTPREVQVGFEMSF